jgi:hypothetical protein
MAIVTEVKLLENFFSPDSVAEFSFSLISPLCSLHFVKLFVSLDLLNVNLSFREIRNPFSHFCCASVV